MPKRTIYVRNEDIERFDSIDDIPGWLHSAIQVAPTVSDQRRQEELLETILRENVTLTDRVTKLVEIHERKLGVTV